jgi:ectoine hydroxylase-related dioxygenase (phytanoyl-CoA dioxygenase family)
MSPEQEIQFETQGFLHIPAVLDITMLSRLKSAFDAAIQKYSVHLQNMSEGFFDIPHILDEDDVFVDVVDVPTVFPILLQVLGGDIQLLQTQARIFPPGMTFTAPWHSDLVLMNGIDLAHSTNFMVKVHYYLEDLAPDQGCLAFIPGSHRYPIGHPRLTIGHTNTSPAIAKIVPKAGDVILFNVHLLHMALDNTSPRVRKSLIYSFSHFWVKNYPSAIPRDLERLATTPERKQLFGVAASKEEGSYFEQTLLTKKTPRRAGELWAAGRELLSKSKRAYSRK